MKAIIVAGGRGERLRPLTDHKPKPMVEVAGKPILLHTVELLKNAGITEFIFALCYLPEVVKKYFGDGSKFGIQIHYILENPLTPLGTAGAIKPAEKYITDTFIVTYADILRDLNVKKMINQHKETHAFATLNVYKRKGKEPKSLVHFEADRHITHFVERPTEEHIKEEFVWSNGSFYIFEPQIFTDIPADTESDFGKQIFPNLIEKREKIYAFPSQSFFIDIGTIEKLKEAEQAFKTVSL